MPLPTPQPAPAGQGSGGRPPRSAARCGRSTAAQAPPRGCLAAPPEEVASVPVGRRTTRGPPLPPHWLSSSVAVPLRAVACSVVCGVLWTKLTTMSKCSHESCLEVVVDFWAHRQPCRRFMPLRASQWCWIVSRSSLSEKPLRRNIEMTFRGSPTLVLSNVWVHHNPAATTPRDRNVTGSLGESEAFFQNSRALWCGHCFSSGVAPFHAAVVCCAMLVAPVFSADLWLGFLLAPQRHATPRPLPERSTRLFAIPRSLPPLGHVPFMRSWCRLSGVSLFGQKPFCRGNTGT